MKEHLIAFRDGSYRKVLPVAWKHSQWIHFSLTDGSVVMVNPRNVNYIQQGPEIAVAGSSVQVVEKVAG